MHEVEELEKRPAHLELSCPVGLQNTIRSEKRPAHQELFFQVCALDIRRRQDSVEIEYTFPLEHFLSDARMRAARDLAGLNLALWERFCEIGATDICQNAEEDALMEWMVRLHAMVAERMVHPLLCGDVRDLKAISSFVRADLEKMERFRSPSGFVELVFDQEVQQFLCDFEEMRLHGDADLAHESLQEMLHRYPQHAALQEIAARESLDQQNPRRALQHLQRALLDDCFPQKIGFFCSAPKHTQALHQDHDALQELEQALLQNPAQMDVWLDRAEIFCNSGNTIALSIVSTRCANKPLHGVAFVTNTLFLPNIRGFSKRRWMLFAQRFSFIPITKKRSLPYWISLNNGEIMPYTSSMPANATASHTNNEKVP